MGVKMGERGRDDETDGDLVVDKSSENVYHFSVCLKDSSCSRKY